MAVNSHLRVTNLRRPAYENVVNPDQSRQAQADLIARIFYELRTLRNETLQIDTNLRIRRRIDMYGAVVLLTRMLQHVDPLTASTEESIERVSGDSATEVLGVIREWTDVLHPLPLEDDNNLTWSFFFAAVNAHMTNNNTVLDKAIDQLLSNTTTYDSYWWQNRVNFYATVVAPEYRRWFVGLYKDKDEVSLPRF